MEQRLYYERLMMKENILPLLRLNCLGYLIHKILFCAFIADIGSVSLNRHEFVVNTTQIILRLALRDYFIWL